MNAVTQTSPASANSAATSPTRRRFSCRSPGEKPVTPSPTASTGPKGALPRVVKAAPAAAPVAEAPAAPKAVRAAKKKTSAGDDLTVIEGIGPKSVKALEKAGITTWAQIASMTAEELDDVVRVQGGVSLVAGSTKSWPKQAKLLVEGKFEEFQAYIGKLKGGREVE